jgi:hypothetical protein
MLGFNGGLMGVRRVSSASAASGLWFQNEQSVAKGANIWPSRVGVYSQSSVYGGSTAISSAIMTDGSFTNTGIATNNNAGDDWAKIDYGSVFLISTVVIGTATSSIPGGWDKSYTENKNVQTSSDDVTWTTLFNTGTFASNGIYTFSSPASFTAVSARYIRIVASSYVALSEFYAS